MKTKLLLMALLLLVGSADLVAQNVAVTDDEGYTPAASAMLDVKSTTKGMLIPRLDSAQRVNISSPALGLLVFDTTKNSFMYYNGSSWKTIPQMSTTSIAGKALFAVTNAAGDTVFAVYNDGVKVTVDEGSKGTVGGFAVSGRTPTKTGGAEVQYFRVTPDSTRIYINDTAGVKGTVGGFAVSGRTPTKLGEFDYLSVTPDSTRVYVNEGFTKGTVGGFAVSGRTPTKTGPTLHSYFLSTTDSTRVYINDTTTSKGTVGGFAVSGRTPTKGSDNYFNVSGNTTPVQIYPSEPRIAWYPNQEAFMAGRVIVQFPDSVGKNSSTLGNESKAYGDYSQAFGYMVMARGDYSTAIGKNAIAHKNNSFAFGDAAKALNIDAYAFGAGAKASGLGSYAVGSVGRDTIGNQTGVYTEASGNYSLAIGQGSRSTNIGSMSFGISNTSSGKYSLAMGTQASVTANYGIAIGPYSSVTGANGIAIGTFGTAGGGALSLRGGTASGSGSMAMGSAASSTGENSITMSAPYYGGLAVGLWGAEATTLGSVAIGSVAKASGLRSIAIGHGSVHSDGLPVHYYGDYTEATGDYAIALGRGVTAQAYASLVVGRYNVASGTTSSWVAAEPLFVIGNGTAYNARSNAFVVYKNGNTGINTSTPYAPLHIKGNQGILNLEGTDHFYMQFYPDGYSAGRKGYFGYSGASINNISLANEISGGNIDLNPGANGAVNIGITGAALKINGTEALWFDGSHFSWGYGSTYNFFADPVSIGQDATSTGYFLRIVNSSTAQAIAYQWDSWSDARVKKDQVDLKYGIKDLMKIKPKEYLHQDSEFDNGQLKLSGGTKTIGLIAQELFEVIPEAVVKPIDESQELWSISYEKLTPVLIKSIQDQQKIIQNQQSEIDALKLRLEKIEKFIKTNPEK